ncbi:MAG: hypothetical protein OXC26_06245, partial [Albidovulum sp.]|nr:hypothetical protein [Albidovulum sp.]
GGTSLAGSAHLSGHDYILEDPFAPGGGQAIAIGDPQRRNAMQTTGFRQQYGLRFSDFAA